MSNEKTLADWREFLATPTEFDTGNFLALFQETWSNQELAEILSPFRGASDMAVRIQAVRAHIAEDGALSPDPVDDEALLARAKAVIDLKRAICDLAGDDELAGILASVTVRLDDDRLKFDAILQGDTPNAWLVDTIGDLLREKRGDKSPAAYALADALYGLRADFDLQWYCLQPMTDLPVPDFTPLFDFWACGGALAIDKDQAIVQRVS